MWKLTTDSYNRDVGIINTFFKLTDDGYRRAESSATAGTCTGVPKVFDRGIAAILARRFDPCGKNSRIKTGSMKKLLFGLTNFFRQYAGSFKHRARTSATLIIFREHNGGIR